MSIKQLFESVDQARLNNDNLGAAVEGKLNELLLDVGKARDEVTTSLNHLSTSIDVLKKFLRTEFGERSDDLVRLMEGAA